MKALDLDTVATFVLVADLHSFTRAAEASGSTQSAVSLKLKRLEDRLGRRLLERTPRSVSLTDDGEAFLARARDLLAAHERAVDMTASAPPRLSIGISDHVCGPALAPLLARIAAFDPALVLEVTIDFSQSLLAVFDRGTLDAVIVRREAGRRDGEKLLTDHFGWFAAPQLRRRAGEPLRLVNLASPCGVRASAIRALDRGGIAWTEVFIGGGVAAVAAAASSGLGVAALAQRVAPPGLIEVGAAFDLPKLPPSAVMLHSRVSDGRRRAALRVLAAALRATGGT
jgi:DNA-binding transcriptional LysR family regulator